MIHPFAAQPLHYQLPKIFGRHVFERGPQYQPERRDLGRRAANGEWRKHLGYHQWPNITVFRLPRQVVQVLVRQLFPTNAGTTHGDEGVGDGLRMALEGVEIPLGAGLRRAPQVVRLGVCEADWNPVAPGVQSGEQVERQCPAKRFFVSRCKLLHTCAFLLDESGAERGAEGRRSAACMKHSGFVQRLQIRSLYEVSKSADHGFAEIVITAKMEPEACACPTNAASLESVEINPRKFMEHLGGSMPRFNGCQLLPNGGDVSLPTFTALKGLWGFAVSRRLCLALCVPFQQQRRTLNRSKNLFIIQRWPPGIAFRHHPECQFNGRSGICIRQSDGLLQTPPAKTRWRLVAQELHADCVIESALSRERLRFVSNPPAPVRAGCHDDRLSQPWIQSTVLSNRHYADLRATPSLVGQSQAGPVVGHLYQFEPLVQVGGLHLLAK